MDRRDYARPSEGAEGDRAFAIGVYVLLLVAAISLLVLLSRIPAGRLA